MPSSPRAREADSYRSHMTTPKRADTLSAMGMPQSAQYTLQCVISAPMQPFPPSNVFWDEDHSDFDGEVDEVVATCNVRMYTDNTRLWTRRAHAALVQYLALKWLLERAHATSAAQLHALQAELHMLPSQPLPAASSDLECF
ncbi:hypothetical protein B0H17DRAFT_1129324 [Mycena rosella]|uniref:Uncharacterized protein n=1 Tax=Mycena rosella TaxID=1033263 RepID=A0AAD7DVY7_MYCRO|nr:hypothetical protein B0H17DRAFT_1129324 [Mycena rosella]